MYSSLNGKNLGKMNYTWVLKSPRLLMFLGFLLCLTIFIIYSISSEEENVKILQTLGLSEEGEWCKNEETQAPTTPAVYLDYAREFPWRPTDSRDLMVYIRPYERTSLLLPTDACSRPLDVIVVVCSQVADWDNRIAIRDTWGKVQEGGKIGVVFIVGRSTSISIQKDVANESFKYKDMIMEDFVDSPFNQTIKSMMMLKWMTTKCSNARYLLKTEDDTFVNLQALAALLDSMGRPDDLLMGAVVEWKYTNRDNGNKEYIPRFAYSWDRYRKFLHGMAYVMSNRVATKLFGSALMTPLLHLEDFFLTGNVAIFSDIVLTSNEAFTLQPGPTQKCQFKNNHLVAALHRSNIEMMKCKWNFLQSTTSICD